MHPRNLFVALAFFAAAITGCSAPPTSAARSNIIVISSSITTTTTTSPSTTTSSSVQPPPPATVVTVPLPPVEPPATEPSTTAPPEAPPATSGGSVEDAISTYFPDVYDQAWNVSGCESGHDPSVVSPGGGNWGLFQINTAHKGLVRSMGYSWDQILDPYVNAAVARRVYDGAGGWGPWSCRRAA